MAASTVAKSPRSRAVTASSGLFPRRDVGADGVLLGHRRHRLGDRAGARTKAGIVVEAGEAVTLLRERKAARRR